jgi:hypothetical protein
MKSFVINNQNRKEIQRKYIDSILGSLDFIEIKERLRDYLDFEKDKESNKSLELEIRHESPDILVDNWEDFSESATLTKAKSTG